MNNRHIDWWNRIRALKLTHIYIVNCSLIKEQRQFSGERMCLESPHPCLTHMISKLALLPVGVSFSSSSHGPHHGTAWVFSWYGTAFPRGRNPSRLKCHRLLWPRIWSHTPSLLQYSLGHTLHPWFRVRKGCVMAWISGLRIPVCCPEGCLPGKRKSLEQHPCLDPGTRALALVRCREVTNGNST